MCRHKDDRIKIPSSFQLLRSRRDCQQEQSVKALREIYRSSRPVRHLSHEQFRKGWIDRVRLDHGLHDCAYQILERCSSMLHDNVLNHAVNLLDVTLVQRVKDRSPIRKILIERADAHAGNFSNPIGCEAL